MAMDNAVRTLFVSNCAIYMISITIIIIIIMFSHTTMAVSLA